MPSSTAATNDDQARARLTVEANGVVGGVTWTASVTDNNPNFTGFGSSGASWNITIDGQSVATVSNASYDFGTGNVFNPYFPRSETNTFSRLPGTYNVTGTFTTTGLVGTATITPFQVTVPRPAPVFTDSTVASPIIRNVSYTDGVSASDTNSYSVRNSANTGAGTLPAGLTLNTSTGAITGTPTTVGSTSFRIRATNESGSTDTPSLTIVVNPPAPVFTDSTVDPTATVGVAYSSEVLASDATTYSVRNSANTGAGTLPAGLTLNTGTGAITGTPTAVGVTQFRIRATNVTGSADTPILTITVFGGTKMWNGTSFASVVPSIWNGTSYVQAIPRMWDGSSWIRV